MDKSNMDKIELFYGVDAEAIEITKIYVQNTVDFKNISAENFAKKYVQAHHEINVYLSKIRNSKMHTE